MLVLLICTDMKVLLVIGSGIEWGFLMPLFSLFRAAWSPLLSLPLPKSVAIATRQKHQLSSLPLHLLLNGAKIDQVSEHRLLGITIDNKLRWDSHINKVCKNRFKTSLPSVEIKVHCRHRHQETVLQCPH